MFFISIPGHHKVGATVDCRINGEPKRLTWRDEKTLVIEPNDARAIITHTGGAVNSFMCADKDLDARDYGISAHPDGSGFIVFEKPARR